MLRLVGTELKKWFAGNACSGSWPCSSSSANRNGSLYILLKTKRTKARIRAREVLTGWRSDRWDPLLLLYIFLSRWQTHDTARLTGPAPWLSPSRFACKGLLSNVG